MSVGTRIAWDDTILPFQLDQADIRGRIGRLDGVLDGVLAQHNYPPLVEALVAEAVLLTALIGQTIKLRWKMSLQVRGGGPVRLIATDYFGPASGGEPARIRAYASYDAAKLDASSEPFAQIGNGFFAVLIDQGQGNEPYQGITPIAGGSLSACAQTYFAQSEQLPTRFSVSFGRAQSSENQGNWHGGGIMLQHMPKSSPLLTQSSDTGKTEPAVAAMDEADSDAWNRVNLLLDTVTDDELAGPLVQPTELLVRLFHQEAPRVFDPQSVVFGCTCSPDRVRASLSIYSNKDIAHMTTDEGLVTADCQFCGAHYEFDPVSLGLETVASTADDE